MKKLNILALVLMMCGVGTVHAEWELGIGASAIDMSGLNITSPTVTIGRQINDYVGLRAQIAAGGSDGNIDLDVAGSAAILLGRSVGKAWPYVALGGWSAELEFSSCSSACASDSDRASRPLLGTGIKFKTGESWLIDVSYNRLFSDDGEDADSYSVALVYAF